MWKWKTRSVVWKTQKEVVEEGGEKVEVTEVVVCGSQKEDVEVEVCCDDEKDVAASHKG